MIKPKRRPRGIPERKVCPRCSPDTLLHWRRFYLRRRGVDRKGRIRLSSLCMECHKGVERRRKRGERTAAPGEHATILRAYLSTDETLRRYVELIKAAVRARSAGAWRGQEGIRAYRDLGIALEKSTRPGALEALRAPVDAGEEDDVGT